MKIDFFEKIDDINRKILGLSEGCVYLYIAQKNNSEGKIETLFYVGQTRRPFGRVFEHLNRLRRGEADACVYMDSATRLRCYILEKCEASKMNALEEKCIKVCEENFGYGLINYKKTGLKDGYYGCTITQDERDEIESKIKDCLFDYLGYDGCWFAALDYVDEATFSYGAKDLLQKIEVNVAFED